jgi:hypothetical protein
LGGFYARHHAFDIVGKKVVRSELD